MTKRFTQIMENMRGLIKDDSWSASSGFLLAVSGGMDSMCMADLFLNAYGPEAFAVAHCNFHLRGEESDGDEALVRQWAQSNGIRFHSTDFNTESHASEGGISIEMAARELRYDWFASLCNEFGYRAVVVAHNANDNAETLVLNLLRGTGLKGLHAMAEVSVLDGREDADLHLPASLGRKGIYLLRPLLSFSRKQIEGYVFANKVPYRDDSTNASCDYKRNRIRNEAFPIFEKINPSFVRSLNREIGYFSEAGDIVEEWCRAQLPEVVEVTCRAGKDVPRLSEPLGCYSELLGCHSERSEESLRISLPALMARRQWRYLLYYILEPYGFNSQILSSLESLLQSDRTVSGKRFDSPTHTLFAERDALVVVASSVTADDSIMPVRGAGIYNFNGVRWQVEVLEWSSGMSLKQPEGILIADADKLLFPFVCRRWRQGDWFIPLGMRGRKKVSDLFADLKYGALEKSAAVMMVSVSSDEMAEKQHIAGVLGVRVDDSYKVTPATKRIIRITLLGQYPSSR